ncbi:MAG: cupin-like domain-containing protein [Burkholderiales bacterium]|nr:cupin-like domain-containing protein [Burkholderiales bacterium]
MRAIRTIERINKSEFEESVASGYEPVVVRQVVKEWPLVQQGLRGLEPALEYLQRFDQGQRVDGVLARPGPHRAFGYREGLSGFNFVHEKRTLPELFEQLWRYSQFPEPPCLAVQSALVSHVLSGLERENPCPLLSESVSPRIWIGNRASVPAHFDDSHNLACVAAGRRRFTLLPPACAPLLYLGPPDHAPTGAPVTVIPNLHAASAADFPLLAQALEQAQVADLEPGDAIYIPPLWFHQVEALAPQLNILMNYWWRPQPAAGRSDDLHLAAMRLAMLAFRHLPDGEREGWRALLDHYVFGARADALDHIPEAQRHLFGTISADRDAALRKELRDRLGA